MNNRQLLLILCIFLSPLWVHGQANQTAAPSLRVEPDPVATGRGFTGVAQADQARAVFWNPAGLAFQEGLQLGLSRFKWLPGLDDELTYNYMMGRYGNIGGHVTFLNLGSQSFRDEQGNSSGNFSSYELSVGLSMGQILIPEKLSVGLGLRFVSSRLTPSGTQIGSYETQTGNTVGIDLGALYNGDEYTLGGIRSVPSYGLAITNFGGRVAYSNSGYKNALPTLLRLGVSNKILLDEQALNTLTVNAEVSKFLVHSDSTGAQPPLKALFNSWSSYEYFNGQSTETVSLAQQLMYGLGLEYWYANLLAIRGGYYRESPKNGGREFITLGGSLNYSALQLNASLALQQGSSAINNITRVGLLISF